jgi:hypothetical protein
LVIYDLKKFYNIVRQDERTIIYNGSGAGKFCPMPFLYDRQFYDKWDQRHKTFFFSVMRAFPE